MRRGTLRHKSLLGLTLVLAMLGSLFLGAAFGLRSFRHTNEKLIDQLPELGSSTLLMREASRLDARNAGSAAGKAVLLKDIERVRTALRVYFEVLRKNTTRFADVTSKRNELDLAFRIDAGLTELARQIQPEESHEYELNATPFYLANHPEVLIHYDSQGRMINKPTVADRIEQLNEHTSDLPGRLHRGLMVILENSSEEFRTSRTIVIASTLAVLTLLLVLARLFRRWVLKPMDRLHFGVIQLAQGRFDHRISLATSDEMQALAEAFNDMANRIGASYAELEQQVELRSRQLVRSERLAGVGFLAAGVSHEINNPLASIAFGAEALESRFDQLGEKIPPAEFKPVRHYLSMIQEEAFRCKRITEKLLDFARGGDTQRERTDLAGLVQSVVEMTRHMGKYRDRSIRFSPRTPLFADVDGQEIKQVVLNLVVNALEAIETGGCLIIESCADHGMARISFTDNGHGMSADVLENVFEPFFTRKKHGRGTGLGLSISHRIINQHGGELLAESPGEGMGATFTIRLPMAENYNGLTSARLLAAG